MVCAAVWLLWLASRPAADAATAYPLFDARCVLRSTNIETASRLRGSPQCNASLKLASCAAKGPSSQQNKSRRPLASVLTH